MSDEDDKPLVFPLFGDQRLAVEPAETVWLGASAVFLFLAMRALRKDLKGSIFTRAVSAAAGLVFGPVKNAATKSFGIQSALFWRLRFSGFAIFEGNPIVWRDRRERVIVLSRR